MTDTLLKVEKLQKHFPVEGGLLKRVIGHVHALDEVTFSVKKGESFGIVGESGCGKTTLARTILRLIEPTGGNIHLSTGNGEMMDVMALDKAGLRKKLRPAAQMVFQDPQASLNTRMTIGQIMREPMLVQGRLGKDKGKEKIEKMLDMVGLSKSHLWRFPHELSGGQKQRVGVARALTLDPDIIICDEAVSALDVSVRAQVVNLLRDLQEELGLAYLFIAQIWGRWHS